MKFGQLIEYKKINTFFSNMMQKISRTQVPDLFSFCFLHEVKAGGLQLRFNSIDRHPLGTQ